MIEKIAVLGAGSWGTALAIALGRNQHQVRMWTRDPQQIAECRENRQNKKYLPGAMFPDSLQLADTEEEAMRDAGIVLYSVPAQQFRSTLERTKQYLKEDTVLVNVAKGIEQKTLLRMSQIAAEIVPEISYVVLSGPSHAEEVGRDMPTTVAAASKNLEKAEYVQDVFMSHTFRVYTGTDVAGVEFGGALKNIIALGAGISDGMGFGDNAKAAMMTRGMTEMSRLGVTLGAREKTFAGLTGMGDLIVTCTSMHSRNRRCGMMIGEGMTPSAATKEVGMVVEGMFTTEAAFELAKKNGVEMPITEAIYAVINEQTDARKAVTALMTRTRKHEMEDL